VPRHVKVSDPKNERERKRRQVAGRRCADDEDGRPHSSSWRRPSGEQERSGTEPNGPGWVEREKGTRQHVPGKIGASGGDGTGPGGENFVTCERLPCEVLGRAFPWRSERPPIAWVSESSFRDFPSFNIDAPGGKEGHVGTDDICHIYAIETRYDILPLLSLSRELCYQLRRNASCI
jgi:hypothetical protein